jgi:hypothetical protein
LLYVIIGHPATIKISLRNFTFLKSYRSIYSWT